MHKNKILLIALIIAIVGFAFAINAQTTETESYESLRKKVFDRRILIGENYLLDGNYATKLFKKPVLKCLKSDNPLKNGSLVDKMLNDKLLAFTCKSMMIKYIQNTNNPKKKRQYLLNYFLKEMYEKRNYGGVKTTPSLIFNCFKNKEYFNSQSREIIKKYLLVKNFDGRRGRDLFLIEFVDLYSDPQIQKHLREQAEICTANNFSKIPGYALMILGRHGDKEAIEKIIKITKELVLDKKQYMLPKRLTCVIQLEIIELLREFLKSKQFRKRGNFMPPFDSVSHSAARALSVMIINFPKVNIWEYPDKKRKECIEWFDKHKNYKFNNKLNF